jgi:DNA repair exonuclease SbcCD nuclease subunit
MKLMIIKDPHFRFGFPGPTGRKDDYDVTMKHKLNQINKIIEKKGVEHLIFTGDVLDKKYPSYYDIDKISKNIIALKSINADIISVAGNHDLPFSRYSNYQKSIYKLLVDANLIRDVSFGKISLDNHIELYGLPYLKDNLFEEINKIHQQMDEKKLNMMILHEHFIPRDYTRMDTSENFVDLIAYDELTKFNKIKVFILGHLHRGFPTKRIGDQLFINPWSLFRLARNYYTLNEEHKPEVVILDTDNLDRVEHIKLNITPLDDAFITVEANDEDEKEELEINMVGSDLSNNNINPIDQFILQNSANEKEYRQLMDRYSFYEQKIKEK